MEMIYFNFWCGVRVDPNNTNCHLVHSWNPKTKESKFVSVLIHEEAIYIPPDNLNYGVSWKIPFSALPDLIKRFDIKIYEREGKIFGFLDEKYLNCRQR